MFKNGNNTSYTKPSKKFKLGLILVLLFASTFIYLRQGLSDTSGASNDLKSLPIYSIWTSGSPRYHQLEEPCIDGITYYTGWSKVEPTEGNLDFSELINVLRSAKKNNKKVNIAFLTGRWSPEWIYNAETPVTRWDHTDRYTANDVNTPSRAPIPWDETYKVRLFKMLEQAGKQIAPYRDVVNSVSITGGSNTNGIEMNFIGSAIELDRIGFTYSVYIENWKSIIKRFSEIFSDYPLSLAAHTHYGAKKTASVSKEIISYARQVLGDRLIVSALAFTEDRWFNPGNLYADLYFKQPPNSPKVLQTMKSYSKSNEESGFHTMLHKATSLHPSWLEVWGADVDQYLQCKPGNSHK